MNEWPLLTLLTLTPFVGGLLLVWLGDSRTGLARRVALGVSGFAVLLVGLVLARFDASLGTMQLVERHAWIPFLGVEYYVGVDGLSLLMLVLTSLVVPMALAIGWQRGDQVPVRLALVLFLEAGLFGTFTALNFFHWFLFWELSLIPAFLLIKLGGGARRSAAALQFFVYTFLGSVTLLLSFVALYQAHGTFDFLRLAELGRSGELTAPLAQRLGWGDWSSDTLGLLLFGGVFLGFAVKVPLMPFHTWLPAAYAEAPTPVTMLLTGLMSKMGVYGFLRILLPLFPSQMQELQVPLLVLAVSTIVFSAAAAFAQTDLKRILAYSSVNHLGYCLLAIFAVAAAYGDASVAMIERGAALNGVLLQMFNHGLTAATLFAFVHFIETRSGGLRGVHDFGGLRRVAPVLTGLMGLALFSSLGLPGLNGFVGEFLIFKGTFGLVPWAAVLALPGLLITAAFLLTILHRVFHGPLNQAWSGFGDLTWAERATVIPAVGLMLVLGVFPQVAVGLINRTVVEMIFWLNG
jgi:NADH-quinone oxidoreductase subunit M